MFAEQKKDFYLVNAEVALQANTQQRHFEFNERANGLAGTYAEMGLDISQMGGASQFDQNGNMIAGSESGIPPEQQFEQQERNAQLYEQQ